MRIGICVPKGQPEPQIGQTFPAEGLAGTYEVRIRRILERHIHPTSGDVLLTIDGVRTFVQERVEHV